MRWPDRAMPRQHDGPTLYALLSERAHLTRAALCATYGAKPLRSAQK